MDSNKDNQKWPTAIWSLILDTFGDLFALLSLCTSAFAWMKITNTFRRLKHETPPDYVTQTQVRWPDMDTLWLFSRKFANFHCNLKCHLVSVSRVRHRYSKVKQRLKENIAT